jgi:hypothetical protein
MDMIGHQAIRQDLDLDSVAPLCHELDAAMVIFVTEKRLLPAVSAMSDVMRKASATTRANRATSSHDHNHFRLSIIGMVSLDFRPRDDERRK